ncbi:hypothetical protein QNO07_22785 [Streptomyces sp. 549]|uniref:hypothetical protein n=1 Tax=Streptomyces sp. 549 TaxID=3049076 RepID=UPI0024C331F3|nr:hypothetical protein [Streptomyces sp. 549]MDK1476211.1 hypothetical protein [Streptomyces sp. 549]
MTTSGTRHGARLAPFLLSAVLLTGCTAEEPAAPSSAGSKRDARDHMISGTVYAEGADEGPWLVSDVVRTTTERGDITLTFTSLPEAGIRVKLLDKPNRTIGSVQTWQKDETGVAKVLAEGVAGDTAFVNAFEQLDPCSNCSPYTFEGTQRY